MNPIATDTPDATSYAGYTPHTPSSPLILGYIATSMTTAVAFVWIIARGW